MDKTKTIEQLVDIILKDNKYGVLKETEKKVDDVLGEIRGPGGHVPDASGPHGRGMGPGKGTGSGLGLEKKEEEETEECRRIREEIIGNLRENSEYQKFFVKMLAKWNVKGPAQLPPEKRKAFFNAVSKGWAAQKGK